MAIRKDFLLNGLLKYNYFPLQKKRKEELPPVFTTSDLTKAVAVDIESVTLSKDRIKYGFDSVQYKSTRFNNVPRLLSIPHPKPYCELCLNLYGNWAKIKHICSNKTSLIRPRKHKDGRVIIMDYETSNIKRNRFYKSAFGKKFIAHTDIANCYPSLYSHSIPWALVGTAKAKKQKNNTYWFNQIDGVFRKCSRNETSGVPIGPATSNIASEIVLEAIDQKLSTKFQYFRFIDDYTAYCSTHSEAEDFIRELSIELMRFKLNLNIKKTRIVTLPQAIEDDWVGRMREIIPGGENLKSSQISNVIDAAVRLQNQHPEASVLKYAANSIASRVKDYTSVEFSKYIIKLCFHYPVLIPTLFYPLTIVYKNSYKSFDKELYFLINESLKYGRSDAAAWLLFYIKVFHNKIPKALAKKIIESGDCIAISLLTEFSTHQKLIIDFCKSLNKDDLYELDNYWLLLYQLFYKGKIKNLYSNDTTFKVMKKNKVNLIQIQKI